MEEVLRSLVEPFLKQLPLFLESAYFMCLFFDSVWNVVGARTGHVKLKHNRKDLVAEAIAIVPHKHVIFMGRTLLALLLWFLLLPLLYFDLVLREDHRSMLLEVGSVVSCRWLRLSRTHGCQSFDLLFALLLLLVSFRLCRIVAWTQRPIIALRALLNSST